MTKKIPFVILILAALVILVLFTPAVSVLAVCNRKNPQQGYYFRQAVKDGFIISYTHSVNKGRVHDYYRVTEGGGLELYRTDFVSYGAGIPEAYETPGAVFSVNGDSYTIENLERKMKRLFMAVGLIAEHSIQFTGSEEIYLKELFPAQTGLVLEYKRVSLFGLISNRRVINDER